MDITTKAYCRRCRKERSHKFMRFISDKALVECCGCLNVNLMNLGEVFQEKGQRQPAHTI